MASRAVPVPGPTAEQGVRAAMVDPGTRVAMADQGTPWAMADQGSWGNLFSWGSPQPLGGALEAWTLGGCSGSDSVSSWNRVGSGERSGSADSREALTLGGALESWAEPAGALEGTGEELALEGAGEEPALEGTGEERAQEGAGEERALKPGSNTSPHMPPTSPGAHEHL